MRWLLGVIGVVLLGHAVEAQTLPSAQNLNQILDNLNEIERFNQRQREEFLGDRPAPDARGDTRASPEAAGGRAPAAGAGACLNIKKTTISGHEELAPPPAIYRRLDGKCITTDDLSLLLNDLNRTYQDRGYIATRVYLPEQDLADGELEIIVVPGRSAGVEFADGTTNRRLHTAFPNNQGDVIDLRDIEQGLENINRVKSVNATFKLFPGEAVGESIIRVEEQRGKPFHLAVGTDNLGTEAVGRYRLTTSVDVDNIFNINDILAVAYTFNLDREAHLTPRFDLEKDDDKQSHSVFMAYSFPIDYWQFEVSGGFSEYNFIIDGVNQDFDVYGKSYSGRLSARRLFYRDQYTRLFLTGALEVKRSRSFIEDVEIRSQNRRITIGDLTVSGDHRFGQTAILWDVGAVFSVPIFGHRDPLPQSIDEHFLLLKAGLFYETKLFNDVITFQSALRAQWSPDGLPGSEKFSIGGYSTVNGFHEDVLIANSGAYLSNGVSTPLFKNDHLELVGYGLVDVGWVDSDGIDSFSQDHLVGAAVGVRGNISKYAEFDLSWGRALSRPDEFTDKVDQFVFTAKLAY